MRSKIKHQIEAPIHTIRYVDRRNLDIAVIGDGGMWLSRSSGWTKAPIPTAEVQLDIDYELICFQVSHKYHFPDLTDSDARKVAEVLASSHGFVFDKLNL